MIVFERWESYHLIAIVGMGTLWAFVAQSRWTQLSRWIGLVSSFFFVADFVYSLIFASRWIDALPLQLCDLVQILSIVALWAGNRTARSATFFLGLTAVFFATLTPNLPTQVDFTRYCLFFINHGLTIAAVPLIMRDGFRPELRDVARLVAWIVFWFAIAATVNRLLGTNFMFLDHVPSKNSILNSLGPWPFYIINGLLLIAGLWSAMALPWRGPEVIPEQ